MFFCTAQLNFRYFFPFFDWVLCVAIVRSSVPADTRQRRFPNCSWMSVQPLNGKHSVRFRFRDESTTRRDLFAFRLLFLVFVRWLLFRWRRISHRTHRRILDYLPEGLGQKAPNTLRSRWPLKVTPHLDPEICSKSRPGSQIRSHFPLSNSVGSLPVVSSITISLVNEVPLPDTHRALLCPLCPSLTLLVW